jgi:hypothetical protein
MKVYLVCVYSAYYPEGADHDIVSIHRTLEGANAALAAYLEARHPAWKPDYAYVQPVDVQP